MLDKLNKPEHRAIETVARNERFEISDISVDAQSLKNGGFCSSLKIVRLKNGAHTLNLVLKCSPTNPQLRETIPFDVIFQREIYFYSEILPQFLKLQQHTSEKFSSAPRCYYTTNENYSEILVLENLLSQEFAMWNKCIPMTEDHIILVMKEYGKFHGLSLLMKAKAPDKLVEIETRTPDIYMKIIKSCGTADTIQKLSRRVLDALIESKENYEVVKRFKNYQENIIEIMTELVQKGSAGQFGVLCHGDAWCNNLLFKYEVCINFVIHDALRTPITTSFFPSTVQNTNLCFIRKLLSFLHDFQLYLKWTSSRTHMQSCALLESMYSKSVLKLLIYCLYIFVNILQ